MKKYLVLLLVLVCSLTFSAAVTTQPIDFKVDLEKGNTFPVFVLESLNGEKKLSNTKFDKKKKTLIVVAAEWCPDCQYEMPEIESFYKKNKNKYNIAVIFTNIRSSEAKVQAYIDANNYTFPVYYDYSGKVMEGTRIDSVPTNIFLDEKGKIINVEIGTIDQSVITKNLK